MNPFLKTIQDLLQQNKNLTEADKEALLRTIGDADKQWSITDFKLDRTEKVKKTTAILLEETIEELEQKRKSVEAQNRELEIESSLERVRAVAMGMKKPDDLLSICEVLFKELQNLGFSHLRNTLINTFVDEQHYFIDYDFSDFAGGSCTRIPYSGHPVIEKYIKEATKKNDAFIEMVVTGKELEDWKEFRRVNGETDDPRLDNIAALYYYNYSIGVAGIGISTFQPISQEKLEVLKRFRNVFDLAYRRYTDIQQAEAQAREAKIEAALEKVRSRSLAVHHSEEFKEVISVVFEKLQELEIPVEAASINIFVEGTKDTDVYACGHDENGLDIRKVRLRYFDHPIANDLYIAHKNGLDFFVGSYGMKEKNSYYEYQFKHADLKDLPAEIKERILQTERYSLSMAPAKNSVIIINNFEGKLLSDTEADIVKRFSRVFEQAYTRFLDLQKAEAQARESQIQLALERVRARTMAMQKSDELREAVLVLYEQLQQLDFNSNACNIIIIDKETSNAQYWVSGFSQEMFPQSYNVPYFNHPYQDALIKPWEEGDKYVVYEYAGKMKQSFDEIFFTQTEFRNVPEDAKKVMIALKSVKLSTAFISYGALQSLGPGPLSEENANILQRFAKVFEQTYTRFLDLQKAEAQAKEAQIEAALERVRSRSMAMQKSEELKEVIQVVYEQFIFLNIHVEHTGFIMDYKERNDMHIWLADKRAVPFQVSIPYFDSAHWNSFNEAKQKGLGFFANKLSFEEKNKFYQDLFKLFPVPDEAKEYYFTCPGLAISTVLLENVGLYIENFSGIPYTNEENATLLRFGKVFQQTYTRFLDLQKAEDQAREAKIEAALERTRTQSMIMQHSKELDNTLRVFHEQILLLGIQSEFSYLWLPDEDKERHIFWAAWAENLSTSQPDKNNSIVFKSKAVNYPLDRTEPATAQCLVDWKNDESIYSYVIPPAGVENYFATWKELLEGVERLKPVYFQGGLYYVEAFMKYGCFGVVIKNELLEDEKKILLRFSIEFERTYTRFLDLQKAEGQAREAQIEAALEKIRSRSLAMHQSDELEEVIMVVSEQLQQLQFRFHNASFVRYNEQQGLNFWLASPGQPQPYLIEVPYLDNPIYTRPLEALRNGVDFIADVLTAEENHEWLDHLMKYSVLKNVSEDDKKFLRGTTGFARSLVLTKHIILVIGNYASVPYTDEQNHILKRFGHVFEQAYTRFLDLQKAEAQTREAQIELGLERVRARAMAMQNSLELKELIGTVFIELTKLDIVLTRCLIMIYDTVSNDSVWWMANSEAPADPIGLHIKYHDHAPYLAYINAWRERNLKWTYVLEGADKKSWDDFLFAETELSHLPDFVIDGMKAPDRVYLNSSFNTFGNLTLASLDPLSNEHFDIMLRFAKVFDLTYTRFNDLQKAEAQALEAIKRASVDRLRAEIASMRTTSDLERVQPLIWNELKTLGVPFIRCGVFIMDEEKQEVQTMLSTPEGQAIATLHVPFDFDLSIITNGVKYWRKKKVYTEHWDAAAFTKVWIKLSSLHETSMDSPQTEHPPESLHLHMLPFLQGMLYVGSAAPLNDEQLQLVQDLAEAFSTAYARYEDFNKLEAAKKQVDNTLNELQVTQKQLIQSEKMASLGELTAGIAHEIQNPLNFVNNFSDVSHELLEEMKTELEKGNKEDAMAIAEDVKQNLEKILHHGRRADAIVKGMLQHSRAGSGQKELTDINVLADEYLRLAYHGLRAKDKSFNAALHHDFDKSIDKVNIIPQDIGRVLVNLINNAFYAVNVKARKNIPGYEPALTITTKKIADKVELRVSDNGIGIPPKVLDKIFHPFFTTKPTGQGTGLGLSMAYDIITKGHGGELKVKTKEGEGSEFCIQIPVSKTPA